MRRVPTSDADGPGNLNAVADAIRQRKLILFVGGGITQSLGLPDFQELVRYLARELGYEVQKLSQADYPVIAEAFVIKHGKLGALRSWMDTTWHPSTIDVTKSEIHNLIVDLDFPTIYTTNYDRWLEREFLLPFSRALGETAWPIPSGLLPGQDWLDTTTLQDNCLGRIIFNHEDEGLRPLLRIDGVLPELLKTEEEIAGIYVVKTVTDKKDRTSQTVSAQADIQRTFKTHSLEIARLCEDQRIVIFKVPMKLDDLRSWQARKWLNRRRSAELIWPHGYP